MFTSYLFLAYSDDFALAARAGLERAISLFDSISTINSVDSNTIAKPVNAVSAKSGFNRAMDLAYEHVWTDGQSIGPIRVAFEALADYVKHETGLTIDDYLTDKSIKVKPTYARISNLIGETISAGNISES